MTEPVEVVHDDTLARIVFKAITETRAPSATVDWEHLSDGEQGFYREAAHRMQAAGALKLLPLPDDAVTDEDEATAGMHVINLRSAVQVDAISVGMMRGENGEPLLVGHFGGTPRDDPERNVGTAWIAGIPALLGMFRQVIGCTAAVDLETAGQLVATTVNAMDEALAQRSPGLVIPAIRPASIERN